MSFGVLISVLSALVMAILVRCVVGVDVVWSVLVRRVGQCSLSVALSVLVWRID
jgi:hypothetical protein